MKFGANLRAKKSSAKMPGGAKLAALGTADARLSILGSGTPGPICEVCNTLETGGAFSPESIDDAPDPLPALPIRSSLIIVRSRSSS